MRGERSQVVSVYPGIARAEPDRSADYRRRARRLRHQHRHDPLRLHQSLRSMADRTEEEAPQSPAASFSDLVERALDGSVLRYTQRIELLQTAKRLGVGRFEANLLIAAVLYRHQGEPAASVPRRSNQWLLPIVVAVVFQAILVLAAWWLFVI